MNAQWCITLGAALFACRTENTQSAPQQFTRRLTPPALPGLPVTVTDLTSGQEIPGLRMNDAGQIQPALPSGHYAFAITTPDTFAFLDKHVTISDNLTVPLSSDCHRVRGRVAGRITLPAIVIISRVSNSQGDIFSVDVTSDGRFSACLPKAAYSIRVRGATVSLSGPLVVPTDAVVLTAYADSEIREPPSGIQIDSSDLNSFASSLRDRVIVGLGEANHGTADFYLYREKLSLELARIGTLRTLLFENDAIGMMALDDYVTGADIDVATSVAALRFWTTDIQEFLTFLADVRAYNASVSADRKIHVLGIDAQRLEPPVQLLLAHRTELAISEANAGLLAQIGPDHGKAFLKLTDDERTALSTMLERLSNVHAPTNLEAYPARASIAARSIRYQLGYVTSELTIGLRDQAMAELATYIVGLNGGAQAAIWGHNGHIARQSDDENKSLGQYLSEKFGERYYPIAFLSYRGSGRAWDKGGQIGVIPHDLPATSSYNVESVVMNATNFPNVAWVRLDKASGALAQWLSLPRYVREFGSAYDPVNNQTLRTFPAAMSAVVVIQHASPSTPTPTGVRRIKR